MKFDIMFGPEDAQKVEVNSNKVTLGRGVQNDIPIGYAGMVSQRHAVIVREGENYFVIDTGNDGKGSTNGTLIISKDGVEIEIWKKNDGPPFPGDKVPIRPGDIIILGRSIWLKFLGA